LTNLNRALSNKHLVQAHLRQKCPLKPQKVEQVAVLVATMNS
jgi:hypothetical protein